MKKQGHATHKEKAQQCAILHRSVRPATSDEKWVGKFYACLHKETQLLGLKQFDPVMKSTHNPERNNRVSRRSTTSWTGCHLGEVKTPLSENRVKRTLEGSTRSTKIPRYFRTRWNRTRCLVPSPVEPSHVQKSRQSCCAVLVLQFDSVALSPDIKGCSGEQPSTIPNAVGTQRCQSSFPTQNLCTRLFPLVPDARGFGVGTTLWQQWVMPGTDVRGKRLTLSDIVATTLALWRNVDANNRMIVSRPSQSVG